MFTLYAKSFSQLCMAYHATGNAMIAATATSFKKSFDSNPTIVVTLAPNTFLTPISFIRWEIAKADRPKRPRQAIQIAIQAKTVNMVAWRSSDW